MASKKAVRAAKALVAPSTEEAAFLKLLAKNTESIIRIEATLSMLVQAMCGESKRNYALSALTKSQEGQTK
jgi:hypothetical protein